ncbi:Gamma-glutamyl cyclotransferase, AIG2-like [Dyella jiangningensis]|nr:gamma-glutamyl AIG2-like cyclotransferase [Dyella sp. AtDHG13]SDK68581.1 Gamma-glutamyl cyclotransferase, AIG2-like [Dyella jiangningensis]
MVGALPWVIRMSDEPSVLLFSYGTLQLERVQLESFGRLLDGEDDAMQGYRQLLVEITDPDVLRKSGQKFHPIVVPSDDAHDEVAGKVFRITPDELAAADGYEVADYKRVAVRLRSGRQAWAYVQA